MDFESRLHNAIERGHRRADERAQAAELKALSDEELKRLHSQHRLQLSERIEKCIAELPRHFPGFRLETLYGDRGWGAAATRDDLSIESGRRSEQFSRLEMTIRPFSHLQVLELAAKGTVRNKELFNRSHFQKLQDVDLDDYLSKIENWTLEYAELYASRR
jgi:hypothetical protein